MKNKILLLCIFLYQLSSAQNGITWSVPMSVGTGNTGNHHPHIVLDGAGNSLVVWGMNNKVYFSRWSGSSFTMPVALNPMSTPAFTESWAGPDIASHGDTVYVVYKETPEDTNHIYIVRSTDGGVNFSSQVQVDDIADSVSRFPSVTADQYGNPVVAFMKFDPGFMNARYVVARSNDLGVSFAADVLASGYSGGRVCDCCPASIITDGNKVITLYRDNLNNIRDIWAGISDDNGTTFPSGINLDQINWFLNSCPGSGPDGAMIGDSLYTVFMSAGGSNSQCYISHASITSMQTGPSVLLTNATGNFPRVASSGNALAVVSKQSAGANSQLALFFTSDISDPLPAAYDTIAANGVMDGDVVLNNGTIHIVWEDMNTGVVSYQQGTYAVPSDVQPLEETALQLYPNPAVDHLYFQLGKSKGQTEISVYNLLGQREMISVVTDMKSGLNISSLSAGVYMIEAHSATKVFRDRFVKQ